MDPWIVAILIAVASLAAGFGLQVLVSSVGLHTAKREAKALVEEAEQEAEAIRRQGGIDAQSESLKVREAFEETTRDRRDEITALEERIRQREAKIDSKRESLDEKEAVLDRKVREAEARRAACEQKDGELEQAHEQLVDRLHQVSGLSPDDARRTLLDELETTVRGEMGALIRGRYQEAEEMADQQAKKVVTLAIQRYAGSQAGSIMSSSVPLPNEKMKGRIIGRNGRNIRALEAATGVNILVDDTPEAVLISGFDPVRREVARQALEQLIADGRIHPARIEEVVQQVDGDMDETIRSAGEDAAYAAGIQGVDPALYPVLGRLKFRSSYAQNVLDHSVEVAHIMATMASELGLDPAIARRVGLFHDIGKAVDHEVDGGHAVIGGDLIRRHGEAGIVSNAVAAHHQDVEAQSLYASLATSADALSGARPGARSETTDMYVKRLEKLEQIASGFEGVEHSYAIQAGREIRVLVNPAAIDDDAATVLARDLCAAIEAEMQYPGHIRVTVIRETRSVEYAK
jgi:ribonuclease Y